jgi:hypothetical protein
VEASAVLSSIRSSLSLLTAALLLIPSASAFQTSLSDEAVREAYFLGQRNDATTTSFFNPYLRLLPKPDKGAFIAEVEVYTPYVQLVETSRRRSMGYSAQQAELDYRHSHHKLYVRVRIDFTPTYGALELYRSSKSGREQSSSDQPLPDFYRDFRVGLSQRSGPDRGPDHEDQWIEPLRILLQPSYVQSSNHLPFIPEDLAFFSCAADPGYSSLAYSGANGFVYPTGWLVWLAYDAHDVASDDAQVEVITTDGQHVVVPFDLSTLR